MMKSRGKKSTAGEEYGIKEIFFNDGQYGCFLNADEGFQRKGRNLC